MSPSEETTEQPPQDRRRWRPPKDIYSVPRRFDLASILVVTTAYALLLTALKQLGANEFWMAYIAGLVTWVAAAQVVLFRGNNPRAASWIAGAVYCGVLPVLFMTWQSWFGRRAVTPAFVVVTFPAVLSGAVLGYLSGAVAAGLFLVIDLVRHWTERAPS